MDRILKTLAERIRVIEESTLEHPPEDFSKFMESVGKRRGLQEAYDLIIRDLNNDEDL